MKITISCTCEGTPHQQDTVTFFDRLDFRRATTVQKALAFIEDDDPDSRAAQVLAVLSEYYLLMGVESWTLTDGRKALPVTTANIRARLLEHPDVAMLVDAADDLYQEQILLPLVARASRSSRPSQTAPSTSAKPAGATPRRPKPSRPSSTFTTQTGDTVTTGPLPGGGSSFLQSSASAD